MIKIIKMGSKGDWKNTIKFLFKASRFDVNDILHYYGRRGVNALSRNTPVDTGLTAGSWYYEVDKKKGRSTITWNNSHIVKGVPIAIILQYGHGTRNGGYVTGIDYINPALADIFKALADEAWREVTQG